MLRFYATIQKELLLLVRDKGGIAILFLMPMALVTIMALIQDAPFRDYQEIKIPLLLVNNDNGDLGKTIEAGLTETKVFEITKSRLDDSKVQQSINSGDYEIGIIIPEKASKLLHAKVNQFVTEKLQDAGMGDPLAPRVEFKELEIKILFAPTTKRAFRSSIMSSLKQSASKLEMQTLISLFGKKVRKDSMQEVNDEPPGDFISFAEPAAEETPQEALLLNSVQHNVPAWTIFGMFFIVISLAGSIIKERQDGSYTRIRTMPGSYATVMTGKITAYLLVCMIQCVLMLLIGVYVLPHLGLPRLVTGSSVPAIAVVALCTGLAATGYGILVGTLFSTHQQASTFGSVSVVILAALGGIWVPVYVMPSAIRLFADMSPLYWALSAFHKIFLGQGDLQTVLPYVWKLLTFFAITIIISFAWNKMKTR